MRITEISCTPEHCRSTVLSPIESTIKSLECHSPAHPLPDSFSSELRQSLAQLSQLAPFPNSTKLLVCQLSCRIWNKCVDLANASAMTINEEQAKLRQVASEMLFLAADVAGIPSPAFNSSLLFMKTGLIWFELRNFPSANNCFDKATDIISKIVHASDKDEQELVFHLKLARSRAAWEVSDRDLALSLLTRSRNLLFGVPRNYHALADQYFSFGRSLLSTNQVSVVNEALKLMNEASELCEEGLRLAKRTAETLNLENLKSETLRFTAVSHLENKDFERVLQIVREIGSGGFCPSASLRVLAMQAFLGLGRHVEAGEELREMVENKGIPEVVWGSALKSYFTSASAAGAETVKRVLLGLVDRCHMTAGAAIKVVRRLVGSRLVGNGLSIGKEGMKVAANVAVELVSDKRVVALFDREGAEKDRTTMHSLLWKCATEYFRSKDYILCTEMFEKSMLYLPRGTENRILRAKGYRVLCRCYLGLLQLDRAEEYINEAEKLETNIASSFLKFRIFLQKDDHSSAITQMQAMPSCLDFSTDFICRAAYEAITSHSFLVAAATLSRMLHFYSSGEPMPVNEVVAFRYLVAVLSQDPANDNNVLENMKRACLRLSEVGPDIFFGKAEVGRQEMNWFAGNAWELGVRTREEKNHVLSAEAFKLAAEFYAFACDGETEGNSLMVCKSIILSVSAIIANEKQANGNLLETEVRQAIELLEKAGKILTSSSEKNDDQNIAIEPNLYFRYTWTAFDLYSRLSDTQTKQIQLVKDFAISKSCNPNHLLHIAYKASQEPRSNLKVATFALNTSLTTLLASPSPDYPTVALIIRKLILIGTAYNGDSDENWAIEMYKQACRIMVESEGEYPTEEAQWLVTTAWDRAVVPLNSRQFVSAKQWMSIALEMLNASS